MSAGGRPDEGVRPVVAARAQWAALGLVLLLGVGVRLGLLLHWPRRLNVDEAWAGLMALHILRGEFPAFMYSVAYQGTPEAYLAAVVFTLAGVSALTLKFAVFGFSCALVGVSFLLGRRLAGWPGGLGAALLTALAPPYLPVFGNYAMLGYMEVVVVGSLVLILTLDLLGDETGGPRRTRRLVALGLLAGVGWWLNPMILAYLGAAGLLLLVRPSAWFPAGVWVVPLGFLAGSLPFWLFNLRHDFWSFAIFRPRAGGRFAIGLRRVPEVLLEIVGVRGFMTDPVPVLWAAAGVVYLACLGALLVELLRRIPEPEARVRRRGVALLVVLGLLQLLAFALHPFAELEGVERYLFPLYSALPVLTAVALLRLAAWSRLLSAAALLVLLLNNALALGKTVQLFETFRRADWWAPDAMAAFLRAEGLTRAYADLRIAARLTFETREAVIATDPPSERYPPYRTRVDAASRVAHVVARPLDLTPARFEAALRGIGAAYRRQDFGEFSVFYDFRAPGDGPLVSLPPDGWCATSEPAGTDRPRAFDRDADSAWLSAAYIEPGMAYQVDLGALVPVAGITVLPVREQVGIPKGYRIELSPDGATWETVAAVPEFVVTLRWHDGQPRRDLSGQIVSRFPPRPARHVRLVQTGRNPKEWWGIAELFVYRLAEASRVGSGEARAALREGHRWETVGDWARAVAAYQRAARLEPELPEAHWRAIEVYEKVGLPIDGSDSLRRAAVFETLRLWDRAAREYERLVERPTEDGGHSGLQTRLLEAFRRQGAREAAERVERQLREEYAPPVRAEARFDDAVRFLGYGVAPEAPRAGGIVELSYYWQALRPMTEDLTVFVHFLRDGEMRFQHDHPPLGGRYPTSRWWARELVRERYRIRLPETLPPGEYEIRLGLWNARTGRRLPVAETGLPHARDHVRLGPLRLLPPA